MPDFKNKVVFLFGPTAVGKTRLLSDFFSPIGEVVNADSVQVYRGLDIGSAKAGKEITDVIPHHLIDILDPWETYNVADFIRLADRACEDIWSRGKLPVISGGTAFYFKHFMYGLSEAPQSDPEIRNSVLHGVFGAGGDIPAGRMLFAAAQVPAVKADHGEHELSHLARFPSGPCS